MNKTRPIWLTKMAMMAHVILGALAMLSLIILVWFGVDKNGLNFALLPLFLVRLALIVIFIVYLESWVILLKYVWTLNAWTIAGEPTNADKYIYLKFAFLAPIFFMVAMEHQE